MNNVPINTFGTILLLLCATCRTGGAVETPPPEFSLNVARLTNVSPTTPLWLDILEFSDFNRVQTEYNGYLAGAQLITWPEQSSVPIAPIQAPYFADDAGVAGLELLKTTRFVVQPMAPLSERWYAVVLPAGLPPRTAIAKQWLGIPLAGGGTAIPFRVGSGPVIQEIRACHNPPGIELRSFVDVIFSEPVQVTSPRTTAIRVVNPVTRVPLNCTNQDDPMLRRTNFVFRCYSDDVPSNYQLLVTSSAVTSATGVSLTQTGMRDDLLTFSLSDANTTADPVAPCRRFVPAL